MHESEVYYIGGPADLTKQIRSDAWEGDIIRWPIMQHFPASRLFPTNEDTVASFQYAEYELIRLRLPLPRCHERLIFVALYKGTPK